MEYIYGITLLKYMNDNFTTGNKAKNDRLFLHFLHSIATILQILQKSLRMNHRDIKINNILLRGGSNADKPTIVLIDYGFACIANGEQEPAAEMSNIEAGAFFGSRHACFKHGRDICQFLYSLHCYFPFELYLGNELMILIKRWMTVSYSDGVAYLLNGVDRHGTPNRIRQKLKFDEGIYHFLRRPEVDPIHCSPGLILEEIKRLL
jgi:serine/threonine protein kinase